MLTIPEYARPLVDIQRRYDFFIGIDSDGCSFDTMEIKHKECFIPNIIKFWDLQAVSKYAREAAEFVNLYSKWRGINRWPALVMVFDLLRERAEVIRRHVTPPSAPRIREFINSGAALSNESLRELIAAQPDPELVRGLRWSEAVNSTIADMVHGVPPFPFVRESLEMLQSRADMIVVSATPGEALAREWEEHDIARYMRLICGQEMGKKSEHIKYGAGGRYPSDHVLMIGDAPGDMRAAKDNDALFFPINPGCEDQSWERFYREGIQRFLNGTFAGDYEAGLIREFEALLPDTPPWKRSGAGAR
jgi:phosphoglycolate phosphatase-like HAD superfamily hydrolase